MKTDYTSSKLIRLALLVFLAVRVSNSAGLINSYGVTTSDAQGRSRRSPTVKVVSVSDSTAILGLFGMATAATGVLKPKKNLKKDS